jgi:probable HAF family extracellular repeat protein
MRDKLIQWPFSALIMSALLAGCGGGEEMPADETSSGLETAQGLEFKATAYKVKVLSLLSSPFPGFNFSYVFGLNDKGDVVGSTGVTSSNWRATLFGDINDPPVDLGVAPGRVDSSYALAINNRGDAVGYSQFGIGLPGTDTMLPTLFDRSSGDARQLGSLPGMEWGIAYKINDKGQAVGYSMPANPLASTLRATLFGRAGHPAVDLKTLYAGGTSIAYGINDSGQIVGVSRSSSGSSRATLFYASGKRPSDLGVARGGTASLAMAINNAGLAVGWTSFPDDPITGTGGKTCVTLFDVATGKNTVLNRSSDGKCLRDSWPMGINDKGQILYSTFNPDATEPEKAVEILVWDNGRSTSVSSALKYDAGWYLSSAVDINNRGQIAGKLTQVGMSPGVSAMPVLLTPAGK